LFSVVALALLLLALPGLGLAANPPLASHAGALPSTGVDPQAVVVCAGSTAPTSVPGASVLSLGTADAFAYSTTAGSTIVSATVSGCTYSYSSTGDPVLAPINLPAGATIWQIDVYGYLTGTGTQVWALTSENPAGGDSLSSVGGATSPSGTGVTHATMTFATGLTLAVGSHWMLDLPVTSSSVGYVGAVVQYTLPTVSLVPITPVRVFDSRITRFGGRILQASPRTINVKDAINVLTGVVTTSNAIPQGARAVSFTVTVTNTGNPGFVAVLPGTNTTATVSTINWTVSKATIAAGGIIALGTGTAERQVTLVVGGGGTASTDVIVDITGYYQ